MIRFFRRSEQARSEAAAITPPDATPLMPEAGDTIDYELRDPTEEELAASFLSEQDFADIAKVMPPTDRRSVSERRQMIADALEIQKASAAEIEPVPPVRAAPDPAPAPATALAPEPAAPAEEGSGEPLIGFWDGLVVGQVLRGWVGDPGDPGCRSLRVALCVDGKEAAAVQANVPRSDVEHGGFEIRVADTTIAQLLLQDRITIRASRDGRRTTNILPLPVVLDAARDFRAREIERAGRGAGPLAPTPKAIEELAPVTLPLGLLSPNSAAILGKDGFLFAYRGPFDVASQYADRHSPSIDEDARGWLDLFARRRAALAERGIIYVQSIAPEKATVLRGLVPPGFGEITARLELIEARIADQNRADATIGYYRSLVEPLRACHAAGVAPFLRLSDGYRTMGAQLAFYQLVQTMAANKPDRIDEFTRISALCGKADGSQETRLLQGDLASHFLIPMYEVEALPDLSPLAPYQAELVKQEQTGEGSAYRQWRNEGAPSKLRVMAFGDGCFGDGGEPRSVAWWLKSMFADVRIVESDQISFDMVDRDRPDILLCQTMERKLRWIPRN